MTVGFKTLVYEAVRAVSYPLTSYMQVLQSVASTAGQVNNCADPSQGCQLVSKLSPESMRRRRLLAVSARVVCAASWSSDRHVCRHGCHPRAPEQLLCSRVNCSGGFKALATVGTGK